MVIPNRHGPSGKRPQQVPARSLAGPRGTWVAMTPDAMAPSSSRLAAARAALPTLSSESTEDRRKAQAVALAMVAAPMDEPPTRVLDGTALLALVEAARAQNDVSADASGQVRIVRDDDATVTETSGAVRLSAPRASFPSLSGFDDADEITKVGALAEAAPIVAAVVPLRPLPDSEPSLTPAPVATSTSSPRLVPLPAPTSAETAWLPVAPRSPSSGSYAQDPFVEGSAVVRRPVSSGSFSADEAGAAGAAGAAAVGVSSVERASRPSRASLHAETAPAPAWARWMLAAVVAVSIGSAAGALAARHPAARAKLTTISAMLGRLTSQRCELTAASEACPARSARRPSDRPRQRASRPSASPRPGTRRAAPGRCASPRRARPPGPAAVAASSGSAP